MTAPVKRAHTVIRTRPSETLTVTGGAAALVCRALGVTDDQTTMQVALGLAALPTVVTGVVARGGLPGVVSSFLGKGGLRGLLMVLWRGEDA